ncbi:MAG: ACP S-malonyltransferase [Flavobacteriales bacterium]|jgi:[acyl-carrier-protein] S-malonyltransferase|nr:ACP S-malonyltransferase [Flavobacteriales bacterium]
MRAFIFPGQGAQFAGMGSELFNKSTEARKMFEKANSILEYKITDIMFGDDSEALKETNVTQPAIFLHSVILAQLFKKRLNPDVIGGHSLGEFSALVSGGYIDFEDGLLLVKKRANAMHKACLKNPSTMAAIIGLDNNKVENICSQINEIVVPANYNCPGQLVISGSFEGIDIACQKLIGIGARRALKLQVGGAFHSPLMEPAKKELELAINETKFKNGYYPIYQNVTATAMTSPENIKENLVKQLTAPVKWTQIMENMLKDGVTEVVEVGPGKVLQGLFKKIDLKMNTSSASL